MPSYDPNNPRQMERLREEYSWSRDELKHSRKMYRDTFRRYVGDRYAEHTGSPETFLLLTRMAFGILRRHLVADNIRTLVTSPVPDLMPVAENLRLTLDDELDKMALARKVRDFVTGGLAKLGVMWIGLDYWSYDGGETGKPSAQFTDFSQWCHDMWARDVDEICFCGHRKRISLDDALNNPLFDHDAVIRYRDLTADRWSGSDEETDTLSGRRGWHDNRHRHFLEFDSIYLPYQNVIIALPVDGVPEPLHEPIPWDGPDRPTGPYHLLCYDKIPNNLLPSPPSDTMAYLDDLANSLMRKMAFDAKNEKNVGLYRPGQVDDALKVKRAQNGDLVASLTPDVINQVRFNGVSSQTLGAFLQTQRLFSWANGGLETLGGLGTGADTVRQEQILLQSASGMIDDMKSTTVTAVSGIVRHIAHYLWRDEMWRPNVPRYAPGVGSVGGRFEIEDRQGDLEDYRINISPYSGAPVTPQTKFNAMSTLILQIAPALAQLAATGAVDFPRAIKHFSRVLDVDEIEDVFNILDTTGMPGPENTPMRGPQQSGSNDGRMGSRPSGEAENQRLMEMMKSEE